MKNINLYYHIYLTDDVAAWSTIFLEQMKCIEDSGLLDNINVMRVTAIAQNDKRREIFFNLCSLFQVRGEMEVLDTPHKNDLMNQVDLEKLNTQCVTENHTYRKIYRDCVREDCIVAYIHAKGITSYTKYLQYPDQQSATAFKSYYYWRQYLNWGAIENWKTMVRALDTHDTAGINYQTVPSPHYSGSFWWANSSWIRQLPDPATKEWWNALKSASTDPWLSTAYDKFADEQWLCYKPGVKAFNLTEPSNSNPAFSILEKKNYPKIKDLL